VPTFRRVIKISPLLVALLVVVSIFWLRNRQEAKQIILKTNDTSRSSITQNNNHTETNSNNAVIPKKSQLEDPASIFVLVNKQNPLPIEYAPSDLKVLSVPLRLSPANEQMKIRQVVENDLLGLFAAAESEGLNLVFGSGYRSSNYQKTLYDGYVQSSGQSEADKISARPGYSEHQSGLALDFTRKDGKCHLDECFSETSEGKWLKDNAHSYGFILRYPQGKQQITGYNFEPWHYRYVGVELAKVIYESGQTYEEVSRSPSAPDYNP
jgi:zinc D-Ala-D-Ala carboxypeptidase